MSRTHARDSRRDDAEDDFVLQDAGFCLPASIYGAMTYNEWRSLEAILAAYERCWLPVTAMSLPVMPPTSTSPTPATDVPFSPSRTSSVAGHTRPSPALHREGCQVLRNPSFGSTGAA